MWLRRSFAFQLALLEGLERDHNASLSNVATDAYKAHLEPHHNWILKSTFKMGLNAMPPKESFLLKLGGELDESERDAAVYGDMAELVRVQQRVLDIVGSLLVELDLEASSGKKAK